MRFEQIEKARRTLGLPVVTTRADFESAWRRLVLKYHPDRVPAKRRQAAAKKFGEITRARNVLAEYIFSYRFVFSAEEFKKHLGPEKRNIADNFFSDHFKKGAELE